MLLLSPSAGCNILEGTQSLFSEMSFFTNLKFREQSLNFSRFLFPGLCFLEVHVEQLFPKLRKKAEDLDSPTGSQWLKFQQSHMVTPYPRASTLANRLYDKKPVALACVWDPWSNLELIFYIIYLLCCKFHPGWMGLAHFPPTSPCWTCSHLSYTSVLSEGSDCMGTWRRSDLLPSNYPWKENSDVQPGPFLTLTSQQERINTLKHK